MAHKNEKRITKLLPDNYGESLTPDHGHRSPSVHRAAACDVISLEAVVLPGGKTMERLYGNGRKFASFSLTSPVLVIEHLLY